MNRGPGCTFIDFQNKDLMIDGPRCADLLGTMSSKWKRWLKGLIA